MIKRFTLLLLFCRTCCLHAQSAADLATLADLKTASQQMQLEAQGVPSFRLTATYQTFDFMGRLESDGHWIEEFSRPLQVRTTIRSSQSPENYAPEDQANIGAPAASSTGTFMQQMLLDAALHPGPSDALLNSSKITYKTQKIGTVGLRCVTLEPLEKNKNPYIQRNASRGYCLAADAPLIRLTQVAYGMVVTYNSIARFGGKTFAQQITVQQRGRIRGKLQIAKLVAAPELLQANIPKREDEPAFDPQNSGAVKLASGLTAGSVISKVPPVYPMEAKMKHISGQVILHAIINKEGNIESLEVISAPSDDLAEASIEAVSQWKYRPYLLNGQPTEVDTTITVNFSFG